MSARGAMDAGGRCTSGLAVQEYGARGLGVHFLGVHHHWVRNGEWVQGAFVVVVVVAAFVVVVVASVVVVVVVVGSVVVGVVVGLLVVVVVVVVGFGSGIILGLRSVRCSASVNSAFSRRSDSAEMFYRRNICDM